MRYYARMAQYILPALTDRPLVLRRFPNGASAPAFYQQNAPEHVPAAVRVEEIESAGGNVDRRFVGGDLATLLYTVQLGAISVDPWHGRRGICPDGLQHHRPRSRTRAPFRVWFDVAIAVREELDALGLHSPVKTSAPPVCTSSCPWPLGSPTTPHACWPKSWPRAWPRVAPKIATIERTACARGLQGRLYVDYLQNIQGKTCRLLLCGRARRERPCPRARVDELTPTRSTRLHGRHRADPRGIIGDLWQPAMKKRNRLEQLATRCAVGYREHFSRRRDDRRCDTRRDALAHLIEIEVQRVG